jgi:hypothetical protein
MTLAGVRTPPSHRRPSRGGRSRGRSRQPVVVARVTLSAFPVPEAVETPPAAAPEAKAPPQSRRDLHAARRLRRRDALAGLAILAAALGGTVAVLDVLH